MSVSIVFIVFGFFVLVHEFGEQGIGRKGWWLVVLSALLGYELIFQHNFGKIAIFIILGFSFYAWRNWFVSLCASLVLMAFLENHETPKGMMGIHGLNPWNFIMLNVLMSWWFHRRKEGLVWDLPRHIVVLYLCSLFVVVWSFLRMTGDFHKLEILNQSELFEDHPTRYTLGWVTSDYLINNVKWMLPAILLYDACRTRRRILQALATVLVIYLLVAIQVNHCMPFSAVAADGITLSRMAARDLDKTVGYFRTEISMMLAGAFWGILCMMSLVRTGLHRFLILLAAGAAALGQAMTGGRAGYVTWGLIGLVFCLVRWRKWLLLIPAVMLAVCLFLPAVRDRMLQGFISAPGAASGTLDEYVMLSGRNLAWAKVIPKIEESPLFGYGRQAMIRIGIYQELMESPENPGEVFPHPHNAYLELLLDAGLVGFFLLMPIYGYSLVLSLRLLRDQSDSLYSAVGGVAGALILALLFASMGSQSFYPKESSVGMWAAIALMLRVYVERGRAQETGEPLFGEVAPEDSQAEAADESFSEPAVPA
jgi:O-antigen ligase